MRSTCNSVKPKEVYIMLPNVVKALRRCQQDILSSHIGLAAYPFGTEDKKAFTMQNHLMTRSAPVVDSAKVYTHQCLTAVDP